MVSTVEKFDALFMLYDMILADRTNGRAYATVLRLSSLCL